MTVFSFKPKNPIMNNKNTIIDTIILKQANSSSQFIDQCLETYTYIQRSLYALCILCFGSH